MGGLQLPAEDRFLNNILVGAGECWLWDGAKNAKGYGVLNVGGRIVLAHRFGFGFFERELASSQQLHHVCENAACVRPEHLEVMGAGDHRRHHARAAGAVVNQFGTWPVYATDEERLEARRALGRKYARERTAREQLGL